MPAATLVHSSSPSSSTGALPVLIFMDGGEERTLPISKTPFTIGRKTDRDLIVSDPRVSREHAQLVLEGNEFYLVDLGSKHGTYVNGERIERRKLQRNDRLDFGAQDAGYAIFNPERHGSGGVREFLSQVSGVHLAGGAAGDLEKMKIFLEAARTLNTTGVLDEVLVTLIDATLRLTRAERGYIFLRQPDGTLRLAAGRNSRGDILLDDKTISHSIITDAVSSASEFLVTDTSKFSDFSARNSIVMNDLRTVICIPLRRPQMKYSKTRSGTINQPEISGVLYLDSRFASREFSSVSNDILRAIATEAAGLVENAHLVQAETAARQYQQELAIAASIQQRLMSMTIPEVPFASVQGRNLSCKEIGGDFFDVVQIEDGLGIVVCDVSGKGVSAALLGSILQGMVYSQLGSRLSLREIAASANKFLCQKILGEKYATLVVARILNDGTLEYINCGHVQPVVVSNGKAQRLTGSNLPVGLIPSATYESAAHKLQPGDRFFVVTDGVTEAENAAGDMFGNERLEQTACCDEPFERIFEDVRAFCGPTPLNDDCTVVELNFRG